MQKFRNFAQMSVTENFDIAGLFTSDKTDFRARAISLFNFQYLHNPFYNRYCDLIHCIPENVSNIIDIPFLPIGFFKNKDITSTIFEPELIFESSKTTGSVASRHLVKDAALYEQSYLQSFQRFYGDVKKYCIIGLLPSYLERNNSSLVYMVNDLIRRSENEHSGFYLNDFKSLWNILKQNEEKRQTTLLFGVTFALLDFASEYPLPLRYTTVIETGGMKGRKKEMTREEVHAKLQTDFATSSIHSEYGMTELLSQAYATDKGIFTCPPWMKMLIRDSDDPFTIKSVDELAKSQSGLGNIIDLANVYSCAFLATDDVVKLHPDETFEILGRSDNSDIRGCSLMVNAV